MNVMPGPRLSVELCLAELMGGASLRDNHFGNGRNVEGNKTGLAPPRADKR
jgi:hypothetical protein